MYYTMEYHGQNYEVTPHFRLYEDADGKQTLQQCFVKLDANNKRILKGKEKGMVWLAPRVIKEDVTKGVEFAKPVKKKTKAKKTASRAGSKKKAKKTKRK